MEGTYSRLKSIFLDLQVSFHTATPCRSSVATESGTILFSFSFTAVGNGCIKMSMSEELWQNVCAKLKQFNNNF